MKKVLICIMVIAVMATSLVLFAGCQSSTAVSESAITVINEEGEVLDNATIHSMPRNLIFNAENFGPASASPGGLTAKASVRLSATVLPETAGNKNVDWVVRWAYPDSEYATGKNVREYVNVIPDFDGSTLATVECYQEFFGNIFITVWTREGGFDSLNCTVSFEGVPTGIGLDTSSLTLDGNIPMVIVGSDFLIPIVLSNSFNNVGSAYCNFTVQRFVAEGQCLITCYDPPLSSVFDFDVVLDAISDNPLDTVSIENGSLKININTAIYSDFQSDLFNTPLMSGTHRMAITNIGTACFRYRITENISGISFEFGIKPVSGVTGVELSSYYEVF